MKIEILFPEFCNLFGDMANMSYLKKCLPEAEFIETPLLGEPQFLTEDINLIYMGPTTERIQEKIIEKLLPYKERIHELIETGTAFLFTGNAMEVLYKYIEDENGQKTEALGLFSFYAKRDMMHRHNSNFRGEFDGTEIIGFKTQFTMSYGLGAAAEDLGFINVIKGVGMNNKCKTEGIIRNNFFGTYLVGPLLIMNPEFTQKMLQRIGANVNLAFEAEVYEAYKVRLADFRAKG